MGRNGNNQASRAENKRDDASAVYVGNCGLLTPWQAIKDFFRGAGTIELVEMVVSGDMPVGASVVTFKDPTEAKRAVDKYTGQVLNGNKVVVRTFTARPQTVFGNYTPEMLQRAGVDGHQKVPKKGKESGAKAEEAPKPAAAAGAAKPKATAAAAAAEEAEKKSKADKKKEKRRERKKAARKRKAEERARARANGEVVADTSSSGDSSEDDDEDVAAVMAAAAMALQRKTTAQGQPQPSRKQQQQHSQDLRATLAAIDPAVAKMADRRTGKALHDGGDFNRRNMDTFGEDMGHDDIHGLGQFTKLPGGGPAQKHHDPIAAGRAEKPPGYGAHQAAQQGHGAAAGGAKGAPAKKFDDKGRKLFVSNLPFSCTWTMLKDTFSQIGKVLRADIMLGADGRSRGMGTVVFAMPTDAARAIDEFDQVPMDGRAMGVRLDANA